MGDDRELVATEWHDDKSAIVDRISDELRSLPDWQGVDRAEIHLANLSGIGGGKTFEVTAGGRTPLILHIDPPQMCDGFGRSVRFDRVREGQALLAKAGLCARRVGEDRQASWYLEEHVGVNQRTIPVTEELIDEIAQITARLHAVPADWAIKYRDRLNERFPALSHSEVRDHLWLHVIRYHQMLSAASIEDLQYLAELGPRPVSAAGSRIVTTHGDIARHNLQRHGRELKLVDLETLGANYAIADFAYTTSLVTRTSAARDRYARAYLEASGLPATPADVFALRLDIERCRISFCWFNPDSAWDLGGDPRIVSLKHLRTAYPALVEIANDALNDEALAQEIVDKGFGRCARVMQVQAAFGPARRGMPVSLHHQVPDDPLRSGFRVNGDGTIQCVASTWPDQDLVLGLEADGSVALIQHGEKSSTLRLDLSEGFPITGVEPFSERSAPLLLGGGLEGSALVHGSFRDQGGELAELGAAHDALAVHVSKMGRLKLKNTLRQTFAIGHDALVFLDELSGADHERFVMNEDTTLSPRHAQHRVIGYRDHLRLVKRTDADRLLFPALAQLWRDTVDDQEVPSAGTATAVTRVLKLASHPGKALTVDRGSPGRGSLPLILVDLYAAEPFLIEPSGFRASEDGGQIALGSNTTQ